MNASLDALRAGAGADGISHGDEVGLGGARVLEQARQTTLWQALSEVAGRYPDKVALVGASTVAVKVSG